MWAHYRQQNRGDEVERYKELRLQANAQAKLHDSSPKPFYGLGCELGTSILDNVKETCHHEMHEALEQAYIKHVGEIVYVHVKKQNPIKIGSHHITRVAISKQTIRSRYRNRRPRSSSSGYQQ